MGFEEITVVSIDGRPGDVEGAQRAIAWSAGQLPGCRCLLLSPQRPGRLAAGIVHHPIRRLGYFEYGLFVLYALHRFIETGFALIVQDDGWVLDGRQWRDEFFEHDYIGAPVHLARVAAGGRTHYLRGFQWVEHLADPAAKIDIVMNGGFSLRSRKLLRAPTELAIPYVVPPPNRLLGPPYGLHWDSDSHLEDVYLCLDLRARLEQAGVRFAPLALARSFSFEHLHHLLHRGLDLMQVLGHHARLRRFSSMDPPGLEYQLAAERLAEVPGELEVAQMFRRRGYHLSFAGDAGRGG